MTADADVPADAAPRPVVVDPARRAEIEAFLHLEARLADESRYQEWFDLWDDELHYWVPKGRADYDPATRISFVNDNRNRLHTRIRQLQTGVHYAQTPPSPMRRIVSNVEILDDGDDAAGDATDAAFVVVGSNFVLYEHSVQASNEIRIWAGRTTHRLREIGDGFRIRTKVVELVNAGGPLPTLSFLL